MGSRSSHNWHFGDGDQPELKDACRLNLHGHSGDSKQLRGTKWLRGSTREHRGRMGEQRGSRREQGRAMGEPVDETVVSAGAKRRRLSQQQVTGWPGFGESIYKYTSYFTAFRTASNRTRPKNTL